MLCIAPKTHHRNAATVYEAIVNGVVENYAEVDDESGALGGVVQDCVEGLRRCLEDDAERADAALREKILRVLFEVYHFDVDFGGVGLSDGVPDLILKHADDAEKKQVAEWVRAAMNGLRRAGNEPSNDWHRQAYGGFLLQLEANALDDEAYLRLCRETHRLNDLVARLLMLKRVDEASRGQSTRVITSCWRWHAPRLCATQASTSCRAIDDRARADDERHAHF